MLDHVTLNVADVEAAKVFYARALAPLGYKLTMDFVEGAGFAAGGKPDFFLAQRGEPSAPVHVAFHSPDRHNVDAFHAAALAAADRTTARRESAACTTSTTTGRTCSTSRATTSRPSRTSPSDRPRRGRRDEQRLGFSRSCANWVMLPQTTTAAP